MDRSNWDEVFAGRLDSRAAEMSGLLMELYPGQEGLWEAFCALLFQAYEQRPERLKLMDRGREAHPDWYRGHDLVGMLLYVHAFSRNLPGLRRRLDYLSSCGVNLLHLMPILDCPPQGDGGYAVWDFAKVNPSLGTMEDLLALAHDCHERGMTLCLDFVMNHTSDQHPWARRARAGEKAYEERYFFFADWDKPRAFVQTMARPLPASDGFTWCEPAGKAVMTSFHAYQWDLNYGNPAVFLDMTGYMLNLYNHGVDGLRLDALPYLWKAEGTSCRNLPQVHALVRLWRMAGEIVCPGTLLLGEAEGEIDEALPFFGSPERPECHLLYQGGGVAPLWHTVATQDVRLLRQRMERLLALPRSCAFLNLLRSPDAINWALDYGYLQGLFQQEEAHRRFLNEYFTGQTPGSMASGQIYAQGEMADRLSGTTASLCGLESARRQGNEQAVEAALGRITMLHALLFSLSGVPVICSGDEVGQPNDSAYGEDPLRADDSRNLMRGAFDWERAARREREGAVEERLFTALRQMEGLRAMFPAFSDQADVWLLNTGNDHVLGMGRYHREQKLLALFNFSQEEQTLWLHEIERYYDLLTGRERDAGRLIVPANGFVWLLHDYHLP